jgi:hypothetical protein
MAADLVLLTHALFVAFILFGLVFILAGKVLAWSWIRNPWFRAAHLLSISIVVTQAWFGAICPLTTLEMKLRIDAGDISYENSFIAHWLSSLIYYEAPMWVFTVCYTVFGATVIASWIWVRPRPFKS